MSLATLLAQTATVIRRPLDGTDEYGNPSANYASVILSAAPNLYYRLDDSDESDGTVAVDAMGRKDGVYVGGVNQAVVGKVGLCADFDGSNDYILIGDTSFLDVTTAFTLEAWINPDTLVFAGTLGTIYGRVGGDGGYLQLSLNVAGELRYDEAAATFFSSGAGITVAGGWYHVAVVFDSAAAPKLKFYVNGIQVGAADPVGPAAGATPARIGANGSGGEPFNGQIDEVALYGRALSAAELLEHVDAGNGIFGPEVDYPARLEQDSTDELTDGRDTTTSQWILFLPATADIQFLDEVRIEGVRYRVDGEPAPVTTPRGLHHYEVKLSRISDVDEAG